MLKEKNKRQLKVERVQELRRSNAAQPHRNKSRYTRKVKHRNNNWSNDA